MKNIFRLVAVAATLALTSNVSFAEVKVGIAAEPYPPFMEKSADGTWVGWEIEMIDAVCAAMGEECEIVPVAWDGIIPALLADKFDTIMASMSITEERMKTISISADPDSLEGKIVGVQVSTTHANYVEAYFDGKAEAKTYAGFDEHNQDLFAGRVDAVVADGLAMQSFLESDQGQDFEIKGELSDEAIFGPGVGAGMRKGDTELAQKINAAIDQIRADGTYDAISAKYFDFDIYGGE